MMTPCAVFPFSLGVGTAPKDVSCIDHGELVLGHLRFGVLREHDASGLDDLFGELSSVGRRQWLIHINIIGAIYIL